MTVAYRAEKVRALEQAVMAVEGPDVLMQRAAAGVAASAVDLLRTVRGGVYGSEVLILVGPGNNGGDALFAGARLVGRGARVTAVRGLGNPHPAGLAALKRAGGRLVELETLPLGGSDDSLRADLVIDGLLGIGGRPGLPEPLTFVANHLTAERVPVLSVDVASGVDADTGAVLGPTIRATRTVTFGVLKPCHLLEPGRSRCGEIELVDIGLDPTSSDLRVDLYGTDLDELARSWPYPNDRSDKYSRGVVGVDTGSREYPGAAIMSTYGAVFGGAGMVRFLGSEPARSVIAAQLPNVVFSPGRVQAHLFGSGWGDRSDGRQVLSQAAAEELPAVVDADGLRYLPNRCPASWLLTPHAGELARLVGSDRSWVVADPVRAARLAAQRTGATVLLKGASQITARPDREAVDVALPGPAWTAQAGSGDVLGGVCAALLAAGLPAHRAGRLGASIQAAAAARHPGVVPPAELARTIGTLLGELEQRKNQLSAVVG